MNTTRTLTILCSLFATVLQAANLQPSDLTRRTTLTSSDIFLIDWNETGTTYKTRGITAGNLATQVGSLLSLSSTYQPLDSDLTSIAALTTTSFGRGLLTETNAASAISTLGLASLYQPLDSDLTSIAALTTTSFGRSLLTETNAASAISTLGLASLYQPLDSDLTSIAALTTTTFGRSLLTESSASTLRSTLDLAGTYQGLDADLTWLAANFTSGTGNVGLSRTYTGNPTAGGFYYSLVSQGSVVSGGTNVNTQWQFRDTGRLTVKVHDDGFTGYGEVGLTFPMVDGTTYAMTVHGANGTIPVVPAMTSNAGKVLAVNGTEDDYEWIAAGGLPTQTGNNGKALTTDGTSASWNLIDLAAGVTGTLSAGNGGTGIASLGTGVATALGVNTGSAGAFLVNGGVLGTPSSATLTNATGLPVSTGISGLGTGVATWLATPSTANLAAAVTGKTGSGALVFGTAPTISGGTITGLTDFGVSMASNTATTGIDLGTTTGTTAQPLTISQVWNNAGATLSGSILKLAVTNTSAASTSKYFEITHGGAAFFSIRKGTYGDPALYFRRAGGSVDDFLYIGAGNLTFNSQGTNLVSIVSSVGFQINSTAAYAWASSSSSEAAPDTQLSREGAGIVQHGADAATVTNQAIKAADGSGTDKAGAALNIGAGQSTGTGRGGDIVLHTGMTGASTGSSANSYSTRAFYASKYVDLTEGSATIFSNIAVASGKIAGAKIECVVYAADGTDCQALASELLVSAINKAGTVTATLVQEDGTTAASAGTLTVTYTAVANGNTVDIKANATSSLTQTSLRVRYIITALSSDGADTTLTTGSIVTP